MMRHQPRLMLLAAGSFAVAKPPAPAPWLNCSGDATLLRGVLASSLAKRAPGYTSLGFPDPRKLPYTPSASTARLAQPGVTVTDSWRNWSGSWRTGSR
jgi:hypothetical protein